jgi:enoyl-CoA hydratase/carnithine racemase
VVILKGAGGHFASGADIAEFGDIFSSPSNAEDYLALMEAAGEALENLPKPAIALIEGYCIGAGLALALACDLRIAASGARLGAPPAKLGLVYGPGDIRRLVAAVGVEAAKSMLFTGALVPAETALSMGLVSELHDGDAAAAAHRRAEAIAALSPWSIRTTKAMINLLERADPGYRSQGRAWFADAVEQGDLAEGVLAFSQRRAPIFRD